MLQLPEGGLDVAQGAAELGGERLGLTPLGGDLARVGEVGVVGEAAATHGTETDLRELVREHLPLVLEQGPVVDGRCLVHHHGAAY